MKYLADTDFLFGLFVPDDTLHSKCKQVWLDIIKNKHEVYVLNTVEHEAATVMSYKRDQATAIKFIHNLPQLGLKQLNLDRELENKGWQVFLKQKNKRTSYIDCTNLAAIEKYRLEKVLSFDKFYPKNLRLS